MSRLTLEIKRIDQFENICGKTIMRDANSVSIKPSFYFILAIKHV